VPYKEPKIEKILYSIGEVAKLFNVNPSLIRFWSNEFDELKPKTNKKGNRLFSKDDIETLRLIYHLVKERGMTLKGAKQKLKDNKEETQNNFEIVKRLQFVKQQLLEIKNQMGEGDDKA